MFVRHRRSIVCWGIVIATGLVTGIALLVFAPHHAPVRPGSADEYWQAAFHLDPTDSLGGPSDAYYVDDEWCAYVYRHLHGSIVYRVPTREVESSLHDTVERLRQSSLAGEDSVAVRAYEAWRDDRESQHDLQSLIQHAIDADRAQWRDEIDMLSYVVANEQRFWQRWNSRRYFWATVCFEWVFFTGLVLLVLWPFIRRWSRFKASMCLGFAPSCLVLPVYLGYATYTFTSHGPAGGILYPYVVGFLPRSDNVADRWLRHYIPPLLESISSPIGEPMVLSGMGLPSLTCFWGAGLAFGVCVCTMGHLKKRKTHIAQPLR